MNESLIYEDRWIVVVDKPSGMPTQAPRRPRTSSPDLVARLQAHHRYVGLHHRLDQPASGLLVFTRDRGANRALAEAFRSGHVCRTYLAVLWGHAPSSTWSWPIEGRPACTHVERLGAAAGLTGARLRLETGRKHQIRIHAAMAGTPVVGDRRYGGEAGTRWPRLALHAAELAFPHPITGEPKQFISPVPADLEALWSQALGSVHPAP